MKLNQDERDRTMSDKPENPPAFPQADIHHPNGVLEYGSGGMTLRDHFAGLALQGVTACDSWLGKCEMPTPKETALWAYKQADEMLRVRELNREMEKDQEAEH